ncbi:TadE/TadG family type IV pilus assembly protein [Microvirga yunnanensis]|uniref:TadE/TadG family type IV pilus assembly protein n=1 Tax=Microvirga yunnanensis TaxID=2953740 RepID=UPI0021C9B4BD|nr:TadE/TadG family type IV pilus assembly protein [Microvirga sp. HBU65207]
MFSVFRRFRRSERGAIIVWFALTLPVVVGLFALSLDLGRFMNLETELKGIADAAALAAAKELDGQDDSIHRANKAAAAVLNSAQFADAVSGDSNILRLVYTANYADLASGVSLDPDNAAASRSAGWVQAITNTGTVTGLFIQVLGNQTMQTSAMSTAGIGYIACDVTPLRICSSNPAEWDDTDRIGRQFKLKGRSGVAGDFSVVDAPNDPSGNTTAAFLAAPHPNFCYTNGVTVDPGQSTSAVYDGLNVRFSIYPQGGSPNAAALAAFPPAPNITKNNPTNACLTNTVEHGGVGALPRDTAFTDDFMGNKGWTANRPAYMSKNHPNLATLNPTAYARIMAATTRYDIYLAELGLARDPLKVAAGKIDPIEDTPITSATLRSLTSMPSGTTEKPYPVDQQSDPAYCPALVTQTGNGANAVYTPKFTSGYIPSRRVFYAAVVNCSSNTGNATPPRTSNRYVRFFMTEPTTKPSDPTDAKTVFGEFLGVIKPGDGSGKLNEIVQLYPNPQGTP